jgi:3-dehydroquinate synthase
MKDERESGLREILNYGHTVGRAIETVSDYKLLHGQAVSIGIVAASKMGARLGYCTDEEADAIKELLNKADLPVAIPDYIDREELVKKLYTDKKVKDGKLRFVFTKGIGDIMVFDNEQYAEPTPESFAREIIMEL